MSWITSLSTEKPYEERLEAENAALRAEIERLSKLAYIGEHQFDDNTWKHRVNELRQQLAASQLEAKRLQGALDMWLHATVNDRTEYAVARAITRKELSSPTSTEALDAYVAERIKDAHEDGHNEGLSYSAPIIAEITRQRDLAVYAIENLVKQKGRHNTEIAYKKLGEALAAIKESET